MKAGFIFFSALLVCAAMADDRVDGINVTIKKRLEQTGPGIVPLEDYVDAHGYIASSKMSVDSDSCQVKGRVTPDGEFRSDRQYGQYFERLATVGDTTIALDGCASQGELTVFKPLKQFRGIFTAKQRLDTFGFAPIPNGKRDRFMIAASNQETPTKLHLIVLEGAKEEYVSFIHDDDFTSYPNITIVPTSSPDKDEFMVFVMNPLKKQLIYFNLTYKSGPAGSDFQVKYTIKSTGINFFGVVSPSASNAIYLVEVLESVPNALRLTTLDKATGSIKSKEEIEVLSPDQGIKSMIVREHSSTEFYILTETSNTLVEYLVKPAERPKVARYTYYKKEDQKARMLDGNKQNLIYTLKGERWNSETLVTVFNRQYQSNNGSSNPVWAFKDILRTYSLATSEDNVSYFQQTRDLYERSVPLDFFKISPMELNFRVDPTELRDRVLQFQSTDGSTVSISIGDLLDFKPKPDDIMRLEEIKKLLDEIKKVQEIKKSEDIKKLEEIKKLLDDLKKVQENSKPEDISKYNLWYWALCFSLLALVAALVSFAACLYRSCKAGKEHEGANFGYSHANTGF